MPRPVPSRDAARPRRTTARKAVTAPTADPTFGVPPEMLHRAWTIDDVMTFSGLQRTAAYRLMQRPDAPGRLNTGGAHRWNGAEILAYLHVRPSAASTVTDPERAKRPDSLHLVAGADLARSTGVTADGIATFAVDPKAVAASARRARVSKILRTDDPRPTWAEHVGVSA